jgi:uncharacterized protein (DUF58 family)
VIVGALGLGLAAMATGNNLLYLILGAMLGLITLSGWLSEVTLRGITVARRVPRGIEAGSPTILVYEMRNEKRLLPSFALEVGERRDEGRGFAATVSPRGSAGVRVERVWERRGVYPLETVTLSTSFPFGLFHKERDLEIDGEVVVWPRAGRAVRDVRVAGDRTRRSGELAAGATGARGEYRSLRGYLPGDDPRDVHWRSTARTGVPVIREYAREQAQALWLCLDLRGVAESGGAGDEAGSRQEIAIELAASLAARAARSGQPFGLVTPDEQVEQGTGVRQLELALDVLARARFRLDAPPPHPPLPPRGCVLITSDLAAAGGWGDVFTPAGIE